MVYFLLRSTTRVRMMLFIYLKNTVQYVHNMNSVVVVVVVVVVLVLGVVVVVVVVVVAVVGGGVVVVGRTLFMM